MTPKLNSAAQDAVLALAAVDYVAQRMPEVPAPVLLILSGIWSYGRQPPLEPDQTYDPEEAETLGWAQALYWPSMGYLLPNMRQEEEPDDPDRWFHDAIYCAALLSFRLIEAAEYLTLPDRLLSACPSDVVEMTHIPKAFIRAGGEAIEDIAGFETKFTQAKARFETRLVDDNVPRWPPFAGITRLQALEWFEERPMVEN